VGASHYSSENTSCSTDMHWEIALGKEGQTIRNSSITTEISIRLTH